MSEVKKRGRPAVIGNNTAVVNILSDVRDGKRPSYYISHQLVNAGYMQFSTAKATGRGRPKMIPELTMLGKEFIGENT